MSLLELLLHLLDSLSICPPLHVLAQVVDLLVEIDSNDGDSFGLREQATCRSQKSGLHQYKYLIRGRMFQAILLVPQTVSGAREQGAKHIRRAIDKTVHLIGMESLLIIHWDRESGFILVIKDAEGLYTC